MLALGRPELDLEAPESLKSVIRSAAPDVVINAAAYTAVDEAEDEPELAMRINADAPSVLARLARSAGIPIIQISSDYFFDGRSREPYAPGAPTAPLGVYGRSKLAGEEAVRAATPDHLIVRTSWLFSPFGRNFLTTMVRLAAERDEVGVVADQRGNPTSAQDLADALLAVLNRWRAEPRAGLGETYHAAGTGATSWYGFASEIFARCADHGARFATAKPLSSQEYPTKAARPLNSQLDSSKFARDFATLPTWEAATAEVVARVLADRPSGHG